MGIRECRTTLYSTLYKTSGWVSDAIAVVDANDNTFGIPSFVAITFKLLELVWKTISDADVRLTVKYTLSELYDGSIKLAVSTDGYELNETDQSAILTYAKEIANFCKELNPTHVL